MLRRHLSAIVLIVLAATVAIGQVFLGDMFKLGNRAESAFPDASATLTGSLLYGTDAGTVYVNTGSAWVAVGPEIRSNGVALARQPVLNFIGAACSNDGGVTTCDISDGGGTVISKVAEAYMADASITSETATAFAANPTDCSADQYATGIAANGNLTCATPFDFWSDAGSGAIFAVSTTINPPGGTSNTTAALTITSAGGGAVALGFRTSGAILDLGGGTNDYFNSDGIGIETPGYVQSNRAITTGPSFVGQSYSVVGTAFDDWTSARDSQIVTMNQDLGSLWVSRAAASLVPAGGIGFAPAGQTHPIFDRQTFSTRILGKERSTYAELAENIACNGWGTAAATVQMYYTTASTTSQRIGTHSYMVLEAHTAGVASYGFPACSSASTTFLPIAYAGLSADGGVGVTTSFCQRVALTATADTNKSNYWVAMVNGVMANDSSDFANQSGFGFRDVNATNWNACVGNGTSTTCTDTGVAFTNSREYLLCAYQIAGTGTYFMIDGSTVVWTATVSNLVNASPIVALDPTAGNTDDFYVGPLQVESQ